MEFKDRLSLACERAGLPPKGRGRNTYLAHHLEISEQAVSKYFELTAVPRRATLAKMAKLLNCDPVWLALGIEPAESEAQRRDVVKQVNAAEDLLASLMTMAGWSIARGGEKEADLIAIKAGIIRHIDVKALVSGKGRLAIRLPARRTVIDEVVVIEHLNPGSFVLWTLDPRAAAISYAGSHLQFTFEKRDGALWCGDQKLKTFSF